MGRRLLEREPQLSAMAAAARDAAGGTGTVVLVHGEAGIGKTSLVAALHAQQPAEGRMLIGGCDALATPRALGPLRDLAPGVGPALAEALRTGDRDQVISALYDELAGGPMTLIAIEDVHWADEATLDVIRFLGRRAERLPMVLLLTFRDDELERDHPLHDVLGDIGHGDRVRRLRLPRLSQDAVGVLAAGSDLDAVAVYDLTGGNPYFVTEVVASADEQRVPPTVVDAVLGRLHRLPRDVQDVVEQLAVIPSTIDHPLLDLIAPRGLSSLRGAEERGLLTVHPHGVRFRHELTRRAVTDSLPAVRRIELNRRALALLETAGVTDPGRLVHHAIEAGLTDAVVQYAPLAARDAAAAGAHREAAAHYGVALAHDSRYSRAEQADLWEECAIERYTVGSVETAVQAQTRAVDLRRELDVPAKLGASLRWLSRMHWFAGNRQAAEASAADATGVSETAGDPGLLALTLSNQAQLAMLAYDLPTSIRLSERAIPIARSAGEMGVLSHALNNLGTSRMCLGEDGAADLLEAVRVAVDVDDVEDASRAYVNLVWQLLEAVRLDEAERYLAEGKALAERAEFIGILSYMHMEQARLDLARGRWEAALAAAEQHVPSLPHTRCVALTVTGTVHVRRGDRAAGQVLEEARRLAETLDELQRSGPVAAARAEAALLRDDLDGAAAIAGPAFEEAARLGDRALAAELSFRLRQAGHDVALPAGDHPFTIQAAGRWRDAAAAWAAAGCPYHQAAALAESPDPDDLIAALTVLDRLGAAPLARRVRAALRRRGVRAIPRGPVAGTRRNPAGLTDRQLDVLRLLADDLTNAAIAERLVLSVRTVDSHVAAILDKLAVSSRRHARDRAAELGLLGDDIAPSR